MAEILIRIVDKTIPADSYRDQRFFKAGDVIHVAEDGWPWGNEELTNPDWRIVKLPGVSVDLLTDMLESQKVTQNDQNGKSWTYIVRRRNKAFDLSHPTVQAYIASGQVITIELSAAQIDFLSRKITKSIA